MEFHPQIELSEGRISGFEALLRRQPAPACLRKFRFDTLKIDRSFIRRVPGNKKDLAITFSSNRPRQAAICQDLPKSAGLGP